MSDSRKATASRSTTPPPAPPPAVEEQKLSENWERWWSGLNGRPAEVVWEAHPDDLTNDLAVFQTAFAATLPVIDFGCGDGRQTRFLAAHFPSVVGIDISPSAIARAQAGENPPNVSYRVLDARRLDAARELHDELGDANVYVRGVLQALPAGQRPTAVDALTTLLGRTGTLFLKELAPAVDSYFAGLTERYGPLPGMARVMELIPPGALSEAELAHLFGSDRFDVLATGAGHIHTVNATPDGDPVMVPALYAVIRPSSPMEATTTSRSDSTEVELSR